MASPLIKDLIFFEPYTTPTQIIIGKMSVIGSSLSAAGQNPQVIPTVYVLDLGKFAFSKVFPPDSGTVESLSTFTVSASAFDIDFATIESPRVSVSPSSKDFTLTFFAYSTIGIQYLLSYKLKPKVPLWEIVDAAIYLPQNIPLSGQGTSSFTVDILPSSSQFSINLNWHRAIDPDQFKVFRSINGGTFTVVGSASGAARTFTDTAGITATSQWTYKVCSILGGLSAFSSTASVIYGFDQNINFTGGGGTEYIFPDLVLVIGNFTIEFQPAVRDVYLPVCHDVLGILNMGNNTAMKTLRCPVVRSVSDLDCFGLSALSAIDFGGLVYSAGQFAINSGSQSIREISAPSLNTCLSRLDLSSNPALTAMSAPVLTASGGLAMTNSFALSTFFVPNVITTNDIAINEDQGPLALRHLELPSLQTTGSTEAISNTQLSAINFPSLISYNDYFSINDNPRLKSIDFPALIEGDFTFDCYRNPLLTTLNFPVLEPLFGNLLGGTCPSLTAVNVPNILFQNGITIDFSGCALTSSSVNQILSRAEFDSLSTAVIKLSGGTNAAPTGQGLIDKATLISNGCTVATN